MSCGGGMLVVVPAMMATMAMGSCGGSMSRDGASAAAAAVDPLSDDEWQVLVRFDQTRTIVLTFPQRPCSVQAVMDGLVVASGIPARCLYISHFVVSTATQERVQFCSAGMVGALRGGKGGFGTLLKGQSKQAGAKTTLDFGACRDLNGRRLRHVNDEIKLRKWREAQALRSEGKTVDEVALLQTASGIRNWHLMVPNWSDHTMGNTKKSRRKHDMQLQKEVNQWQSAEERVLFQKRQLQQQHDATVAAYVNAGAQSSLHLERDDYFKDAIAQGLKNKAGEKRKLASVIIPSSSNPPNEKYTATSSSSTTDSSSADATPSFLCTMSGDFMVDENAPDSITGDTKQKATTKKKKKGHIEPEVVWIQSVQEFSTASLLLSEPPTTDPIYYEVTIRTGGVCQMGWATSQPNATTSASSSSWTVFSPNCDTGDGVGDDRCSWGYDGSRQQVFEGGAERQYGDGQVEVWKEGDVIGCLYDPNNGVISYSHNGTDLGPAFTILGPQRKNIYPALSLNQGQIVGLHVGPHFKHLPKQKKGTAAVLGVCSLLEKNNDSKQVDANDVASSTTQDVPSTTRTEASSIPTTASSVLLGVVPSKLNLPPLPTKTLESKKTAKQDIMEEEETKSPPEPVDLNDVSSVTELQAVGMERLKDALLTLGVKCGGSLEERAKRLFSLKGLERKDYPMKVRGKNFVV